MLLQGKDTHNKFTGNMSVHYQTNKKAKKIKNKKKIKGGCVLDQNEVQLTMKLHGSFCCKNNERKYDGL